MNRDKFNEYKAVKNYIHNDVGINRDFIKECAEKYIDQWVEKLMSQKIDSGYVESLIVKKFGELVTGEKDYSKWLADEKVTKKIQSLTKEVLKEELGKLITFDQIKIISK